MRLGGAYHAEPAVISLGQPVLPAAGSIGPNATAPAVGAAGAAGRGLRSGRQHRSCQEERQDEDSHSLSVQNEMEQWEAEPALGGGGGTAPPACRPKAP